MCKGKFIYNIIDTWHGIYGGLLQTEDSQENFLTRNFLNLHITLQFHTYNCFTSLPVTAILYKCIILVCYREVFTKVYTC